MERDPHLSELLSALSEESLYKLLGVVKAQTRRQALRQRAGDPAGDLTALRTLEAGLEVAHDHKLYP